MRPIVRFRVVVRAGPGHLLPAEDETLHASFSTRAARAPSTSPLRCLLTRGPPFSGPLGLGWAFFPPPGRPAAQFQFRLSSPAPASSASLISPDQQLPHSPASHAPFAGAVMAFGRRSPRSSRHPPALAIVTALLLAFLSSAAAAAAAASSSTDAMHNNNWAVLVCTSRFW